MMKKEESSFQKTWNILMPFLLYFIVHDLAQVLLALLMNASLGALGGGYEQFMLAHASSVNGVLNALSLLIGMASVFPMAKKEFRRAGAGKKQSGETSTVGRQAAEYLILAIFAVSLALGVNILLTLTGLTEASDAYHQVAEKQYGVAFGVGIIVYGILSPLAEEIVFRGLIYNRMKRYFNTVLSVIVCGVLFGVYHGNLVQGIYGCILGIAITYTYELYGSFLAPALFHSAANVCVFIIGYDQSVLEGIIVPVNCVIFMSIAFFCLCFMIKLSKEADVDVK